MQEHGLYPNLGGSWRDCDMHTRDSGMGIAVGNEIP